MFPIRISSPKVEGVLQVSKWSKLQVLLGSDEMEELLLFLNDVHFVVVSEPVRREDAVIAPSAFLQKYGAYADALKEGRISKSEEFRRYFSSAMAVNLESFYAIASSDERFLIKPITPVVQLQAHHFFYSPLDNKIHLMVLSAESVTWGVQFSYPQLCQNPKTREIAKIDRGPNFPNTALFLALLKWMRSATLPTPFFIAGKRVNAPIRIGKKSLAWIKNHPQLKERGITIAPLIAS